MQRDIDKHPWDELDRYRGTIVAGEWPTLPELLRLSADKFGGKTAFSVFEGRTKHTLSFDEVLCTVRHEAARLGGIGVKEGDKVMLMGRNSPDWALSYFAIPECGGVSVPMDSQMKADKCVRLAKFADVRAVIADSSTLRMLEKEDGTWFSSLLGAFSLDDCEGWERLSLVDDPFKDLPRVKEDDIAAILFTSGTTGNEKGVELTHRNITSDGMSI